MTATRSSKRPLAAFAAGVLGATLISAAAALPASAAGFGAPNIGGTLLRAQEAERAGAAVQARLSWSNAECAQTGVLKVGSSWGHAECAGTGAERIIQARVSWSK